VSVATAVAIPGTVCNGVGVIPEGDHLQLEIEHPTGHMGVEILLERTDGQINVAQAALIRTARWLFDGNVSVPRRVWTGR
jgi:4-oxalomesaconate tautomerase